MLRSHVASGASHITARPGQLLANLVRIRVEESTERVVHDDVCHLVGGSHTDSKRRDQGVLQHRMYLLCVVTLVTLRASMTQHQTFGELSGRSFWTNVLVECPKWQLDRKAQRNGRNEATAPS